MVHWPRCGEPSRDLPVSSRPSLCDFVSPPLFEGETSRVCALHPGSRVFSLESRKKKRLERFSFRDNINENVFHVVSPSSRRAAATTRWMGTDLSIALIKPPMYLSEYYTRISRLKISKFNITRLLTFNYQLIIYEYWILIEIIIFISQSYYNEFLNFIKRQIRFLRRRSNYFSLIDETLHWQDNE